MCARFTRYPRFRNTAAVRNGRTQSESSDLGVPVALRDQRVEAVWTKVRLSEQLAAEAKRTIRTTRRLYQSLPLREDKKRSALENIGGHKQNRSTQTGAVPPVDLGDGIAAFRPSSSPFY